MTGIGHNRGPAMDAGVSWRRHCWRKARADLLPTLPLEVIRGRVRRAQELGLDYRTYAGVRATTGRDIVAFLFSTNALHMIAPQPAMPEDRAARLRAATAAARTILVNPPLTPEGIAAALGAHDALQIDAIRPAPGAWATWRRQRETLLQCLAQDGHHAATVLLVGDTPAERGWAEAARLAGYLPAESYFGRTAHG